MQSSKHLINVSSTALIVKKKKTQIWSKNEYDS